jgi:hypothetical protein
MSPSQTIEFEFAPTGHPLSMAMSAVKRIEHQLEDHRYRLVPLVRVDGRLVDALGPEAHNATSYTWRIYLAPLDPRTWRRLCHTVLGPLANANVAVRTRALAA